MGVGYGRVGRRAYHPKTMGPPTNSLAGCVFCWLLARDYLLLAGYHPISAGGVAGYLRHASAAALSLARSSTQFVPSAVSSAFQKGASVLR